MKKKWLYCLLTLIMSVTALFAGCLEIGGGDGKKTLQTPKNFAYNEETYTLSWESVENATGYVLDYNGKETALDGEITEYTVILSAVENTFKLKATGDKEKYEDSAWTEVTYTLTGGNEENGGEDSGASELSLYDKINIELSRAAAEEGYTLERVIGISYADTEEMYKFDNICIETISKKNNINYNVLYGYSIDNASNFIELLNNIDEAHYNAEGAYPLVSYNSAEKLVQRKTYDGEMEKLRSQGYTISVLDSCVREGKTVGTKFRYEIVGTYKAENAYGDVKYFTSVNQIDVANPNSNPINNYETIFMSLYGPTITEKQFVLHEEGATLEYMAKLIEQQERALAEKENK